MDQYGEFPEEDLFNDTPETKCPRCGRWIEDMDGFGVVRHESCGYCSHISIDGGVCGLCGEREENL